MELTTVAELGTALGTIILALATYASVRSGNRTAVLTERNLLAAIRPLLVDSRRSDDEQKVGFADDHWVSVKGGGATAEVSDEAVYFTISLRNVGTGLAVLNGWRFVEERQLGEDAEAPSLKEFHRLTRDIYVAPQDTGFWQGVYRDAEDELFKRAAHSVKDREAFTIDLLYGDADGGQRVISRFSVLPLPDEGWMTAASRHWNLDRDDPR